MPPTIGYNDEFEGRYTEKFRLRAGEHGEFVKYERDRTATDLGVHLTYPAKKGREVSHTRIWFQLKGIKSTTLPYEKYAQAHAISLPVSLDHLKFWFASPEPIYLVLYVECVDKFLVEDVQEIVHRGWGEEFLRPETFPVGQEQVTVKLSKDAELTPATWAAMLRHQSMRIDGPFFRGRPLGHRLDPLRCSLNKFDPAVFCQLVGRLLDVHGYHKEEDLEPAILFPNVSIDSQRAVLTRGMLHHTFEWVFQMTTEYGIGANDDFRIEGKPLSAQGRCAVFIHGDPRSYPDSEAFRRFAGSLLEQRIPQLLVFANLRDDPAYFGAFFSATRGTGLSCIPLLLGEIAYSLLTTTVVYLEFREAVSWRCKNYLW